MLSRISSRLLEGNLPLGPSGLHAQRVKRTRNLYNLETKGASRRLTLYNRPDNVLMSTLALVPTPPDTLLLAAAPPRSPARATFLITGLLLAVLLPTTCALGQFQYRCRLMATAAVPYAGSWAFMSLEWGLNQPAVLIVQPGSTARVTLQAGFWDSRTGRPVSLRGAEQMQWELAQQAWVGNLRGGLQMFWVAPGILEIRLPPDTWGDAALRLTSLWMPTPQSPRYPQQSASVSLVLLAPRHMPQLPSDGTIDGYPLGRYPSGCCPPEWFVPVPDAAEDHYLTPFFRLSEFTCAQPSAVALKYTVIDYALLEKLEKLQRVLLNAVPGTRITTSNGHGGYRSPQYNAQVGGAARSRHMWGDAFDFRVVQGTSRTLADLNGDGVVGQADGEWLRSMVRDLENRALVRPGGFGIYGNGKNSRLFFHIDTRGQAVDWKDD